jgi:hypothetical protein
MLAKEYNIRYRPKAIKRDIQILHFPKTDLLSGQVH